MKFLLIAFAVLLSACSPKNEHPAVRTAQAPATAITPAPKRVTQELFTKEELAFIKQKQVIRVGVDQNYPPFVFYNNEGKIVGLSIDYLDAVAKVSGLNFSIQRIGQRAELIKALQDNEVDVLTSVRPSPDRSGFMMFTQPYTQVQGVFVHNGIPLDEIHTVGVGRGYAASYFVSVNFPNMERIAVANDEESIRKVVAGQLDAAIMSNEAAAYLESKVGVELKTTPVAYSYPLGFGFSKTGPYAGVLSAIVVKSIESLEPEARDTIDTKWLKYPSKHQR